MKAYATRLGDGGRGYEKQNMVPEKIGKVEIVDDILPKPEDLIFKKDTLKVTLNLSKSSVEFFKGIAQKHGSRYQRVIRKLLDRYAAHYSS